jgi:hypothetical protein
LLADPEKQGFGYWRYSLNELGIFDWSAQLDHIHLVKCQELAAEGDPMLHPLHALDLLGLAHRAQGEAAFGPSGNSGDDAGADSNPSWRSLLSTSSKRGMSRNFSDSRLMDLASLVSQSETGLDLGLQREPSSSEPAKVKGWLGGRGPRQQPQHGQNVKHRGKKDGRRSAGALASARRLFKGVLRPWNKLSQLASPAATAAATAGTAAVAVAAVTGAVAAAAAATAVATAAAAPAVAAAALSPRGRAQRKGVVKPRGSGSPLLWHMGGRASPMKQRGAATGAGERGGVAQRRTGQGATAAADSEDDRWNMDAAHVGALGAGASCLPTSTPAAAELAEKKPTASQRSSVEGAPAVRSVGAAAAAAGVVNRGPGQGRRGIRAPPMQIPAPDLASSPDEPRTPEQLESPLVQCASELLGLEEATALAAAAGVTSEGGGGAAAPTAAGTEAADVGVKPEGTEDRQAAGTAVDGEAGNKLCEQAVAAGGRSGGTVSPFGDAAVQAAAVAAGWGSSTSSSKSSRDEDSKMLRAIRSGEELSCGKVTPVRAAAAAGFSLGRGLSAPQQQQQGEGSSSNSSSTKCAGVNKRDKPLARQSLPLGRLDLNRCCKSASAVGLAGGQGSCSCTEQSQQERQQQRQRGASLGRRSSFSNSSSVAPCCSACKGATSGGEPYDLRVVAHSLGGATALIYVIMRRMAKVRLDMYRIYGQAKETEIRHCIQKPTDVHLGHCFLCSKAGPGSSLFLIHCSLLCILYQAQHNNQCPRHVKQMKWTGFLSCSVCVLVWAIQKGWCTTCV